MIFDIARFLPGGYDGLDEWLGKNVGVRNIDYEFVMFNDIQLIDRIDIKDPKKEMLTLLCWG
jgi:hypothetical protein